MPAVEVTEKHVDQVTAIARRVGELPACRLAGGVDEAISQAYVVLWDLALSWDPDRGVPFEVYVSMHTRHRLLDWVRREVGRAGTPRLKIIAESAWFEAVDPYDPERDIELGAGPEMTAFARETLAEVVGAANGNLSRRQRDVLFAELEAAGGIAEVADEWGMSTATAMTHRSQARRRLREALTRGPP
jgi:RNA polymerase sigma factor (sigma-70 family)